MIVVAGTALWTGTPLRPLLEEAGLLDETVELLFTGACRTLFAPVHHQHLCSASSSSRSRSRHSGRRVAVLSAVAVSQGRECTRRNQLQLCACVLIVLCCSLVQALRDEMMLAYEMNGQPLTPAHGFPLRLICPGSITAQSGGRSALHGPRSFQDGMAS